MDRGLASAERMDLTVVVLTFNEERHLARCLNSVAGLATRILVVDSFSTDRTANIAREHGAQVLHREFVNHATSFNWALTQLPTGTEWILRIDADEVLSAQLREEIRHKLPGLPSGVRGVYLPRSMVFQGTKLRYGGVRSVRILRLFRWGFGRSENRWMDEHISVDGDTVSFDGELVDENLNSLSWWTDKHNRYASREAVEMLNLEYHFMESTSVAQLWGGSQTGVKRWVKENVYARLPSGVRALAYFLYRYVLRLGFLDGRSGTAFHVLQGFWYRFLVDAKVAEVKRHMRQENMEVKQAIHAVLGVKI